MHRRADLIATGLDDLTLSRLVAAKEVDRVRRGVYAEPWDDPSAEQRHRRMIGAAVRWLEPGAVVCCESAAVLHGLPVDRRRLDHVHLVRSGTSGTKTGGTVILHRRRQVRNVVVDGIGVTPVAETAVDCARRMSFRDGVAVVDAALRSGADPQRLEGILREQRARGNPRARQVLAFADARSESAGESHSRAVMQSVGIPIPALQVELRDRRGRVRLDFAWEADRLAGEFDGVAKYQAKVAQGSTHLGALAEERDRQRRIEELGWTVIRWDWTTLQTPGELRRRYDAGVALARRR